VELVPGGRDMVVDGAQAGAYVEAVWRTLLCTAVKPQLDALRAGFDEARNTPLPRGIHRAARETRARGAWWGAVGWRMGVADGDAAPAVSGVADAVMAHRKRGTGRAGEAAQACGTQGMREQGTFDMVAWDGVVWCRCFRWGSWGC
jgi:hypothetical protein